MPRVLTMAEIHFWIFSPKLALVIYVWRNSLLLHKSSSALLHRPHFFFLTLKAPGMCYGIFIPVVMYVLRICNEVLTDREQFNTRSGSCMRSPPVNTACSANHAPAAHSHHRRGRRGWDSTLWPSNLYHIQISSCLSIIVNPCATV